MNNNIEEDYCSFEVSKLLKEKGFDCECKYSYENALKSRKNKQDGYSGPFGYKKGELNIDSSWNKNSLLTSNDVWYCCSRPTHSLAIKWIRENYQIEVGNICIRFNSPKKKGYQYIIISNNYHSFEQMGEFDKPEEAIEAALLYTLTNLI